MEYKYVVDGKAFQKAMVDAEFKSFSALAKASGVDRNTIAAIADGNAKPNSSNIGKLANALKLDDSQVGSIFFKRELA